MKKLFLIFIFVIGFEAQTVLAMPSDALVTCEPSSGRIFYVTKSNPNVRVSYEANGAITYTILHEAQYDPRTKSVGIRLSSILFVNNRWTVAQSSSKILRPGGQVNLRVWSNPGAGDFRHHDLYCYDSGL